MFICNTKTQDRKSGRTELEKHCVKKTKTPRYRNSSSMKLLLQYSHSSKYLLQFDRRHKQNMHSVEKCA